MLILQNIVQVVVYVLVSSEFVLGKFIGDNQAVRIVY